ncbi:DUF1304 domain-containing protein [Frigoribacterium sp. 2-23]|uniref:DUF1304 domain-containing protein n=1 Tax=Frigoribacterium sp. 2-23 TaxID=3415006 RepID=UPI003C6F7FE9
MILATQIVAAVAAVLHIVFFVFESVLWTRPAVYARFGIESAEAAETIRPMAYNQGFYNLALAVGALVGIVLIGAGHTVVGLTLVIFAMACMAFAGLILVSGGAKYLRPASLQFIPAALALVLAIVSL